MGGGADRRSVPVLGADNCVTASLGEWAPGDITLAKGVAAGTGNLLIGVALGGSFDGSAALAALGIGAVGYGTSITLWVAGARELGAARGQLVFATAPFVGALVAWTVFGEDITARQIVSVVIAMVGVSFVMGSQHLHEHRHDALVHEHEHSHDDGHHDHHAEPDDIVARHSHRHAHAALTHAQPHTPDLHHRHAH
jgi:EamA-like transporter family